MRRARDSINPRTHPDIMLLSGEDRDDSDPHPYWYARVLGIYHVEVRHDHPNAVSSEVQVLEFLWVRWLGQDADYNTGSIGRRLYRVGFVPDDLIDLDDPSEASGAFGFIDPAEVIRGVHLIPAFAYGKTDGLLGPSIARPLKDDDQDWQYFYVNMYYFFCFLTEIFYLIWA
jgi:hypothetical protein